MADTNLNSGIMTSRHIPDLIITVQEASHLLWIGGAERHDVQLGKLHVERK